MAYGPFPPNTNIDNQQAWAALPLIARDKVLGGVQFSFLQPHLFDEPERQFLQAIADYAAQALERSLLAEQAKEAATLQERYRFARDLHDSVSQVLFASTTIAESTPRLWERSGEKTVERLNQIITLNRAAMAEMRVLLLELRPESIAKTPLSILLTQLVMAVKGRKLMETELKLETDALTMPADVVATFYRIAQESINNILKHSQATHFTVDLTQFGPQQFRLSVIDNGIGFDLAHLSGQGLGLQFMRERAEAVGAPLHINSKPGEGTRITAVWPGEQ